LRARNVLAAFRHHDFHRISTNLNLSTNLTLF
jgi:hypothetical protein